MTEVVAVSVDKHKMIAALKSSATAFIRFYMPELEFKIPQFHIESFHTMTALDLERVAEALPRGHAKTTLAKLATVYHFNFTPHRFAVYLSNTNSVAANACLDIAEFLRCDNHTKLFGKTEFTIARESEGYYKFKHTHVSEQGELKRRIGMLKAQGAGQQVRGLNIDNVRPSLAVVDDLEDNEETDSELLQDKLIRWFMGAFIKALARPKNKVIHIGNMLSGKCLLAMHCNNPNWVSKVYGCLLSDGTPLWEDIWNLEALKQDFNDYMSAGKIDVWFIEMMNMAVATGQGLIELDKLFIKHKPGREEILYAFITIDPAISDEAWSHQTAIVVHGFDGLHWHLMEYKLEPGMDPVSLFKTVIPLALDWQVTHIGIESVAYQAAIKPVFEFLCEIQGYIGFEFVNMPGRARKTERLFAWAGLIKDKTYALSPEDLLVQKQLLEYRPKSKTNEDDLIDAAAYGAYMINEYLDAIITAAQNPVRVPLTTLSAYQACEV